jgi:hypothetical protein
MVFCENYIYEFVQKKTNCKRFKSVALSHTICTENDIFIVKLDQVAFGVMAVMKRKRAAVILRITCSLVKVYPNGEETILLFIKIFIYDDMMRTIKRMDSIHRQ